MSRIIVVEGYKAFFGIMRIRPVVGRAFEVYGDWLYRPDTGCWYCKGRSYPAEVCEVLVVE